MPHVSTRWAWLVPALTDAVALLVYLLVRATLREWLAAPATLNVLLILAAYAAFVVGAYLIRKMYPAPGARLDHPLLDRRLQVALAVLLAAALMVTISWHLGFLASLTQVSARALGEGEAAVFFVIAPGAWLAVAFFYVLVVASTFTPAHDPTTRRGALLRGLALLGVNALLIVAAVQLHALLEPRLHRALAMILTFLALFLLVNPPHFLDALRQRGRTAWTNWLPHPALLILLSIIP